MQCACCMKPQLLYSGNKVNMEIYFNLKLNNKLITISLHFMTGLLIEFINELYTNKEY